jgi:ATP-dependent Clp protease protease subunit
MQYIRCPIQTICMGMAASMAAVLLSAGTKGKRYALPNARTLIHQPMGGIQGQATDMEIQTKEILKARAKLDEILAFHTGQPIEKIAADTERNFFMSAEESKEYGLIDEIIKKQK